jgi:hypothetical protein
MGKMFRWFLFFFIAGSVAILTGWALVFFFLTLINYNPDRGVQIENVPGEVNEFLDASDIREFQDLEFPVHFGLNPPNVEGTYFSNSRRIDFDKMGVSKVNDRILDSNHEITNHVMILVLL